jgi:ribonuclease HI
VELKGCEEKSTKNRMELMASIEALSIIPLGARIRLVTDSAYVKGGVMEWMPAWKLYGWTTAKKAPVKHQDLWMDLDRRLQASIVSWEWVKGYNTNPMNEWACLLANSAIPKEARPKKSRRRLNVETQQEVETAGSAGVSVEPGGAGVPVESGGAAT